MNPFLNINSFNTDGGKIEVTEESSSRNKSEPEKFIDRNWHFILIILVVLVLVFFLFKEKFMPTSLIDSDLPYSAGGRIRMSSIDSATNRGRTDGLSAF